MSKIAAYRDPSGTLYARSAACTHVGCHLHWNSFETCWDCPCHGSHFAIDGTPLNAPAIGPLAEVNVKTEQRGDERPRGNLGPQPTSIISIALHETSAPTSRYSNAFRGPDPFA